LEIYLVAALPKRLCFVYRGLVARSITTAQNASPTFTHVYAALVAIINSRFPQNGELILRRVVAQFRRSYRRNQKVSRRWGVFFNFQRVSTAVILMVNYPSCCYKQSCA